MTGGIITQVAEFGSRILQFIDAPLSLQSSAKNSFYLFVLTSDEFVTLLIQPNLSEKNGKKSYEVKQVTPTHFLPINSSNINSSCIIDLPDATFCNSLYEHGKSGILKHFEDVKIF